MIPRYFNRTLCTLTLMMFLALLFCSTAIAQDEFTLEEIIVTGSRIARNNQESTSPIVTVDRALFDQSSTGAIETMLNKLPQFTPTIDVPQIAGMDIQPTATNTPGEATVALRGIGANRTLVLINSRRGTPSNALGVLDINTIPTAAIQYVEAISGGASSTYGADAMAGVLNFIMKDRFEGFELNVNTSTTQRWDNEEITLTGVMGTNFDDYRGNVMLAFSYNDRKGALQAERKWFRDNMQNPEIGGNMFFPPFTGVDLGMGNWPDPDVLNDLMDLPAGQGFGEIAPYAPNNVHIWAHPSGRIFSGASFMGMQDIAGQPGIPAAEALGIVDGYEIKYMNNGNLSQNNIRNFLIFPLERYNFYTQGDYEINDHIGVFGQAYFSRTNAKTIQEPGVIRGGWGVRLDPTIIRDSLPADVVTMLDSRPDPDAPFTIHSLMPHGRQGETDTFTFNMTAGIEGNIPVIDWTYEAFASHGEAESTSTMTGFYSLMRLREVMTSPDFGRGMEWKGNEDYDNFGSASASCTSGLNPFDWGSVTDDCWDAVAAPVRSKQLMRQTIYEVNSQGAIMDLPAGEMRGAGGLSYRVNRYEFQSDNVNTQGRSFNDQVLGLYPAGESIGTIQAKEMYAELLVPVISDLPFIEQFNLELGGRRSDYNTTGVSYTYKGQFDWRTSSFLRLRGGYNRAERAPNIAELFLARTSSFGAMSYGDVCSMRNTSTAWTASPTSNPDNWADIVALCGQLMDATGNPSASFEFYGADWQDIVAWAADNPGATIEAAVNSAANPGGIIAEADYNNQPGGGFGWIWPVDIGNPNLIPETADTWTFGFVLDSPVTGIPALSDWRIAVDYYMIDITDAIGLQSGDVVLQQCMSPEFNPTFDPNSPFCQNVERNAEGGFMGVINRTYFNNGNFRTSGIDMQINWGMQAGPGRLGVNMLLNYLLKMESRELPTNPMIDYVGTFGPSGNGLNGNSFEWRALTTVTYSLRDWDVSLRWQFLDSLRNLTGTNTPLPRYNMFDLMGNWRMQDNISFRFGIENFLDRAPKLYNRDYNSPTGMYGGSFSTQNHDVVGRRFYLGTQIFF